MTYSELQEQLLILVHLSVVKEPMISILLIFFLMFSTSVQAQFGGGPFGDTPTPSGGSTNRLINGSNTFTLDASGHVIVHGVLQPTILSGCGVGGSIETNASDMVGGGATGTGIFANCVLSLGDIYALPPFCVCNREKTVGGDCAVIATTSDLTIVGPMASERFTWHCFGGS